MRVPLTNASITDCVFDVKRKTTEEEVNKLLKVRAGISAYVGAIWERAGAGLWACVERKETCHAVYKCTYGIRGLQCQAASARLHRT